MDEIIERLTSKHGIDRFLTGGCGAFAVALYMDLKRRGKQPTIVTILRTEPLDPNVQLKHFDLNYSFNEPQDQLYAELAELINLPTTK